MMTRHIPVLSAVGTSLLSFILLQVIVADGHFAAFVGTDGKPNMNTRPIRRQPQDEIRPKPQKNPYELANGKPNFFEEDENEGDDEQANFTPFISARALSNIPGFFQHLRENLEALQSEQNSDEYHNDMGVVDSAEEPDLEDLGLALKSPEEFLRTKPFIPDQVTKFRWQPIASGLTHEGHRSNTRSFVERPKTTYLREPFIRRAAVSKYNPAWSYTKLGLGKRRR